MRVMFLHDVSWPLAPLCLILTVFVWLQVLQNSPPHSDHIPILLTGPLVSEPSCQSPFSETLRVSRMLSSPLALLTKPTDAPLGYRGRSSPYTLIQATSSPLPTPSAAPTPALTLAGVYCGLCQRTHFLLHLNPPYPHSTTAESPGIPADPWL